MLPVGKYYQLKNTLRRELTDFEAPRRPVRKLVLYKSTINIMYKIIYTGI